VTAPATLPHVDAVLAALAGASLANCLGVAPQGQLPPYIAVYPDPGRSVPGSLADPLANFQGMVQLTCVGESAEQALNLCDRARSALGVRLAVEGRSGWRPEELGGPPVQRDDDVTPPLYYAAVQYRLRSTPV
jgi:hypothetical protein